MKHFDVFNGDADGLCALHQLRLAAPLEATIVTGVKRDIRLLGRAPATAGDSVTVLDISLDTNRNALLSLLNNNVTIDYFDHHYCGQVPPHPGLRAFIDTAPDICTGIIVDRYLGGLCRPWAVVAAFGDNMRESAKALAASLALTTQQTDVLRELGECLNYNAYGDSEADLIAHPAALYTILHRYASPFAFADAEPLFRTIREARAHDMATASLMQPDIALACGKIYRLPDAAWSRRVRGAYGNVLANIHPDQANAVLTPNAQGGYTVSVRAPLVARHGAAQLCRRFPGGGGREAAAGIDHLPPDRLPDFIQAFEQAFRV